MRQNGKTGDRQMEQENVQGDADVSISLEPPGVEDLQNQLAEEVLQEIQSGDFLSEYVPEGEESEGYAQEASEPTEQDEELRELKERIARLEEERRGQARPEKGTGEEGSSVGASPAQPLVGTLVDERAAFEQARQYYGEEFDTWSEPQKRAAYLAILSYMALENVANMVNNLASEFQDQQEKAKLQGEIEEALERFGLSERDADAVVDLMNKMNIPSFLVAAELYSLRKAQSRSRRTSIISPSPSARPSRTVRTAPPPRGPAPVPVPNVPYGGELAQEGPRFVYSPQPERRYTIADALREVVSRRSRRIP